MPKRKIPDNAFEYYFSLGCDRSYGAVAENYSVSKTAIANLAVRDDWKKRLHEREQKAQELVEKKAVETIEQMADRHIKVCKLIQRKAIETLKALPISTAMEAVRALDLAIKQERLIRGEPTDRANVSIEEVIRGEYDRWMVVAETGNSVKVKEDGNGRSKRSRSSE